MVVSRLLPSRYLLVWREEKTGYEDKLSRAGCNAQRGSQRKNCLPQSILVSYLLCPQNTWIATRYESVLCALRRSDSISLRNEFVFPSYKTQRSTHNSPCTLFYITIKYKINIYTNITIILSFRTKRVYITIQADFE